jgi:hypothetical protein
VELEAGFLAIQDQVEMMTAFSKTSLEPTPIMPACFRSGFRIGEVTGGVTREIIRHHKRS